MVGSCLVAHATKHPFCGGETRVERKTMENNVVTFGCSYVIVFICFNGAYPFFDPDIPLRFAGRICTGTLHMLSMAFSTTRTRKCHRSQTDPEWENTSCLASCFHSCFAWFHY